ncbi:MAG: hypothetical protein ACRCWD_04520 [Culicoidibacterales bacterium]
MGLRKIFGQLSAIERILIVFTCAVFLVLNFFSLVITEQKLAIDDQILELEQKTKQLENDNRELELKISELTTYDRIIAQANAAGMGPNQENIRTVQSEEGGQE